MRSLVVSSVVVALASLVGCIGPEEGGTPVELPLSGFPAFAINVNVSETGVHVDLSSADDYQSPPCPRLLESFAATLDGERMSVERGSVEDLGLDSTEYVCIQPSAYTTAHGRNMRLADDSFAYDVDLGDATDYRTMQLASTTVTRGQPVDITWSSAEDLLNQGSVNVTLNGWSLATTIVDGKIRAVMPSAESQLPGNATLSVIVDSTRPCPYSHCEIRVHHEPVMQVTVE